MKSIKFLISAALLFSCVDAFCCLPISYEPKEYYMYRVYDRDSPADGGRKEANCRAYQELTSPDISLSDIESVVYGYTLEQVRGLSGAKDSRNAFARYIATAGDTEIVDFLAVAKTCENARAWMNDPWYYPAKNDPTVAALEEVIEKSLAYSGRRLEDRYVLQAVRAMMSLKRYSAIDSLWRSRSGSLREGVVKEMIRGYVAGALLQKGERNAAFRHFKAIGDLKSIRQYWPEYRQSDAIFYFAARQCPDSPQVPELLQSIVGHMEEVIINETVHHGQKLDEEALSVLYSLSQVCLRAATRSEKKAAEWYYTAAFLLDCAGCAPQAEIYAVRAKRPGREDSFISDMAEVLEIKSYLEFCDYNDESSRNYLLHSLKWLDKKIASNITDDVREKTAWGWHLTTNFSYYYWNDMLRKIVLGTVVPKLDSVDPVLSLRLRNMADNRLLSIVDRGWVIYGDPDYKEVEVTMKEYRASGKRNIFDYSNEFFLSLDSMPLQSVKEYERQVGNGKTELDRFLDERGFIDHDYLLEVIGTRHLRRREYKAAVEVLSKVSPSYENRLNVSGYFNRLPFDVGNYLSYDYDQYKLSFAKEMLALETKMRSADPDKAGEAMIKYGTGLHSSFDFCWALTHYDLSYDDEWLRSNYRKKAIADGKAYIETGLKTIRTPELAAKYYVEFSRFKTVAEKFPQTSAAQKVRASCDKLVDYSMKSSVDMYQEYVLE